MPQRTGRQRRTSARPRKARRSHLLIIECDAAQLAADGLGLAVPYWTALHTAFPDKDIHLIQTTTTELLLRDLENALAVHGAFRSILILGHSNSNGLIMTSDSATTVPWNVVGQWLKPFRPELLFLVACEAGRSEAVRGIFNSVEDLRQIYASPIAVAKIGTAPIGILVVEFLRRGRINRDTSAIIRASAWFGVGSLVFRWRRGELGPGEELTAGLIDLASSVADMIRRR